MREPQVDPHGLPAPAPGDSDPLTRLSDPGRLVALRQTGLFDAHADGTFDHFAHIASRLLSAPISLVTLLDDQRQFFAGAFGPCYPWQTECSTSLTHSLCKYVAAARTRLALEDARVDPRFNTCGAVQELRVVAYLGVPIITPDAEAVGSFCVIDQVPRSWSEQDVQLLEELGALVNKEVASYWQAGERKRLAELLKRDDALAETVVEVSPANLYIFDAVEGHCLYANREFWPSLGYTIADVTSMGSRILQELMHPEDLPGFMVHLAELRATPNGESRSFEYRLRHASGSWRWYYSRDCVLSRDASGAVSRIVGGALDITALKEAERMLREADQRKDEFLAMLAHELRNPLAAIRHAVDVLGEPVEDHEALAWARMVLDRQSRQLAAIVDDLLDVAKITRGKVTLRRVPVDLAAVVQRAVQMLTPPAQARGQSITFQAEGDSQWVEGDPARLEQIVVNLINNAIKHCEDGIKISTQIQREGGDLLVRVRDNGAGIEPARLDHIFELFAQLPANAERAADGLGIGLTLVKRLTELHGGTVRALSDGPGLGSEFQVRIPALTAFEAFLVEPAQSLPESVASAPPRKPERILIVDDNEDSARGLTRILERRAYKVASVHTGSAALFAAQEFLPDVVLLDIGLPGMDGHQVAEQLRANGFRDTVLIAMTGYGQERDLARSRKAGCDFHFVKPVDTDALLSAIEGTEMGDKARL